MALAAALGYLLKFVFERFSHVQGNKSVMGRNLILVTMTTTVIISIVKSSLALSLGLVGALSIVRFRTAIKEPEELAYLFISIALGLGLGADQRLISVLGFSMIMGITILTSLRRFQVKKSRFYHLIIGDNAALPVNALKAKVTQFSESCVVKRLEQRQSYSELALGVHINDAGVTELMEEIQKVCPTSTMRFIEPLEIG